MDTRVSLCDALPFFAISDDAFNAAINYRSDDSYLDNLEYSPFDTDECKYNSDLNVNEFYVQNRLATIPKTNYIYLDDFPTITDDTLTICNFYIRSIPKNMQYFTDTIMLNFNGNLSVLGLTETRLDSHLESLYELPGYQMYANSRIIHGGGVAMYVSSAYPSTTQNQVTISEPSLESIGVEMTILTKKYTVCFYAFTGHHVQITTALIIICLIFFLM